jgi:hypothetical protein
MEHVDLDTHVRPRRHVAEPLAEGVGAILLEEPRRAPRVERLREPGLRLVARLDLARITRSPIRIV